MIHYKDWQENFVNISTNINKPIVMKQQKSDKKTSEKYFKKI